jgi:hypothetical protein
MIINSNHDFLIDRLGRIFMDRYLFHSLEITIVSKILFIKVFFSNIPLIKQLGYFYLIIKQSSKLFYILSIILSSMRYKKQTNTVFSLSC